MILFVHGPTHVGKTVFARELTARTGVSNLSVDLLKMGLIRSGVTRLTPEDDEALTAFLWPVVREMARTALENRQPLIIEGDYLPEDWRASFEADAPVAAVGLAMTESGLRARYGDVVRHRHAAEIRRHDAPLLEELLEAHAQTRARCARTGERLFLIDVGFEDAVESAVRWASQFFAKEVPSSADRR